MKILSKKLIATSLLLLTVACGEEDKIKGNSGLAETELEGTWNSACLESGDAYEKKSIIFTTKTFKFESGIYSDSDCAELDNKIFGSGEYALGDKVSIDGFGSATAIDYIFDQYTWTFSQDTSDAVDYAVSCGSTATNGSFDVNGKTCEIESDNTIVFHSNAFGVIAVKDEKLLMTDSSSNGGTEEERSTSLRIDVGWDKEADPEETTQEE